MDYCRKCGNEISKDSKFCKMCGTQVQAPIDPMRVPIQDLPPDVFLEYLYRGCVTILVGLFVILAGTAIHPVPSFSERENVAIIGAIFASFYMIASLLFEKKLLIISDGMLVGGILSLVYSIWLSLIHNEMRFTFFVVFIGLTTTIYTGYLKFVKPVLEKEELQKVRTA